MSKKVYETVALVKEIEVTPEEYEVSFQPVQKYSLDQLFLCLEKDKVKETVKSQSVKVLPSLTALDEWVNEKSTYKFFKTLQVKVSNDQSSRKVDWLQVAAMKGLPVQIQFKDKGKVFKLTKIRVNF